MHATLFSARFPVICGPQWDCSAGSLGHQRVVVVGGNSLVVVVAVAVVGAYRSEI